MKKVPKSDATNNSKEYVVETIQDNAIYVNKAKDHLSSLHYLVAWKDYLKEENTLKPSSVVQNLKKLISFFLKNHPEKLFVTFSPINSAPLIAKTTI